LCRQIGSKVLGHWLNQIRKTRKNDGKSNGNEANGVKKRFLVGGNQKSKSFSSFLAKAYLSERVAKI
jgi:hypothetical protein